MQKQDVKQEDKQPTEQHNHADFHPSNFHSAPVHRTEPYLAHTNPVAFPLNGPSQLSSDVPLGGPTPLVTNALDAAHRLEATRAISDDHALAHCTEALQQHPQSATVRFAAAPLVQPLQLLHSVQDHTLHGDNRLAQPHSSPVQTHGMGHENGVDSVVNDGESTPPRPAALLRETCLATPVSQRPADEFNLCEPSQLKGSPHVVAQVPHVDRHGTARANLHSDQQDTLGTAAINNASEGAHDPPHDQERARSCGDVAQLRFDDAADLGDCMMQQQASALLYDSAQRGPNQASVDCIGELTLRPMHSAPVSSLMGDAIAAVASDTTMSRDVGGQEYDDEDDRSQEVCWRVLGAQMGPKPDQAVSSHAAPSEVCDLRQLPPPSVACTQPRAAIPQVTAGHSTQRHRRQGADACVVQGIPMQHKQPAAHAARVPAHSTVNGDGGRADRMGSRPVAASGGRDPSAGCAAPAVRGGTTAADAAGVHTGDAGKGRRKPGGVWKARKANLLVCYNFSCVVVW